MPEFLIFTLYAPIAALGEIAVGERRMGWPRPGKSAVLGLVAAALGIARDNEAAHQALASGYGYAVRTDAPGHAFVDYHTTQVAPERRGRRFATRRGELAADNIKTILSTREYRADALYTAVLWCRDATPFPLVELQDALRSPRYTLYLGRKSAPLGLPLAPAVVAAESLAAVLSGRPVPAELSRLKLMAPPEVAFDLDAPGMVAERIEQRRDDIASRRRWQFALRGEGFATVAPPEAAS